MKIKLGNTYLDIYDNDGVFTCCTTILNKTTRIYKLYETSTGAYIFENGRINGDKVKFLVYPSKFMDIIYYTRNRNME